MIKGAMGSADGGPKEPGGTQLAEVQHGLDSFQEDGGEHQPDESEMGVPNPRQLPERLIIRMPRDFGNEYVSFGNEYVSFEFHKIENNLEIMYESNRGSNWALTDERMLLTLTQGEWIVYDSARLVDNMTIFCRQAVFVADGNITERGWKTWRYNLGADDNQNNGDYREEWSGRHFWAETEVS